jgi:hypothetical protein
MPDPSVAGCCPPGSAAAPRACSAAPNSGNGRSSVSLNVFAMESAHGTRNLCSTCEVHPRWRQMIDRNLQAERKGAPATFHVTLVHSTHHAAAMKCDCSRPARSNPTRTSRANIGVPSARRLSRSPKRSTRPAQRRHRSFLWATLHGTISADTRGYGFIRTTAARDLLTDALHHLPSQNCAKGRKYSPMLNKGQRPQAARVTPRRSNC